jgi:hypothetical protein
MRTALILFICLIGATAMLLPGQSWAQSNSATTIDPQIHETGQAYRDATGSSAQTEVRYYDPDGPAPVLSLDQKFEPEEADEVESTSSERVDISAPFALIAFLVLVIIVFIIAKTVGTPSITFQTSGDSADKPDQRTTKTNAPNPEFTGGLNAIRGIADRRIALTLLASAALMQAADANKFRISRSWTLRDALSRVPSNWTHRHALAELTRAAEFAHFGGREVPEDVFQAHFDASQPIFRGR